jgi:hypothetical protein
VAVETQAPVIVLLKERDSDILGGKYSHVEAKVCEGADECSPKIVVFTYFDITFGSIIKLEKERAILTFVYRFLSFFSPNVVVIYKLFNYKHRVLHY